MRQHTSDATMDPADAPEITRGSSPAVRRTSTTPRWYTPMPAPPLKSSAVRPCAWRHSLKKAKRASTGTDASRAVATYSSAVVAAVM